MRSNLKKILSIACLMLTSIHASAMTHLGNWVLSGTTQSSVYRDGTYLRVINPNGQTRSYQVGSTAWSLVGVRDTNGSTGSEIVLRVGNTIMVIDHTNTRERSYNIGNVAWAVMNIIDINKTAGDEILIAMPDRVRVISDKNSNYRDITINANGWALYGVEELGSSAGPDLIINIGNGILLADPRNGATRTFTFQGYTAIAGVSNLNSTPEKEIYGRHGAGVYVITGGITKGTARSYSYPSTESWAIYGSAVDTNGKEGNELIIIRPKKIDIISHANTSTNSYNISNYNYVIDSVGNLDNSPGAEILVRDTSNKLFVITDRTKTIKSQ